MNQRTRLRIACVILVAPVLLAAACSTSNSERQPASAPADAGVAQAAATQCPQPRETEAAPGSYVARTNPLPASADNLERGRRLYQRDAGPVACAHCHGVNGDGNGPGGRNLVPPPRNFACAETMRGLSDGQLYWVIENGSGVYHLPSRQGAQEIERPGRRLRFTAMRMHRDSLSEADIWQLILYIRTLETKQ